MTKWILSMAALLGGCAMEWQPAFNEQLGVVADTVAIASLDEALTFARVRTAGGRRLIAVTRYERGAVQGIDLGVVLAGSVEDPIPLFRTHGYDRLHDAIRSAPASAQINVAATQLDVPVDLRDHHIAVGTNYAEHAGDAGTTKPFLFAKMVQPTDPRAPVTAGNGLLDYEVELAFVPLVPIVEGEAPATVGVMLCNDYTDRQTLMYAVDSSDIESGKGFTTGKSFRGYLPVGDLFVIPRDYRAFADRIQLQLYVNGHLRQRAATTEMIWNIDEILAQTWARRDVRWQHRERQVSLWGETSEIPPATLIMTGTPHGTVFSGVPLGHKLRGVLRWALAGWNKSVPHQVIDVYVERAREARAYLQPGDDVTIRVDRLGMIRNTVIAAPRHDELGAPR